MNKRITCLWVALSVVLQISGQGATLLSENFDNIATLPGSGWVLTNNSVPVGSAGWFQGNASVFGAQAGLSNAYIGANFNDATFGGNISNWLLFPTLTLDATSTLTFYTRTENPSLAPDRIEVRLSTNGSSTNVGANDTSVGDFTTLLLTINATQMAGGYPNAWTQFTVNLAPNIVIPTNARLAFRYFVTDTSVNGDYIGIDTVVVTGLGVPEPSTVALSLLGVIGVFGVSRYRKARN